MIDARYINKIQSQLAAVVHDVGADIIGKRRK
jgi:hypothetical protein